jgi:hypothetical protein
LNRQEGKNPDDFENDPVNNSNHLRKAPSSQELAQYFYCRRFKIALTSSHPRNPDWHRVGLCYRKLKEFDGAG